MRTNILFPNICKHGVGPLQEAKRVDYYNMIIDPDFKKQISHMDIEYMSDSQDTICIVDNDLRLVGYNDAWINFANNNNGESALQQFPLGANISDAGEEPIKSYIEKAYRGALQNNKPFEHDYECSSPEKFRVFHQTAYPLIDSIGLVITNHLVQEKPHTEKEVEFNNRFVNEHGIIIQCANCRKIRNPVNPSNWYWVPSLVKSPLENISHSLCVPCLDHYYPDIED
jgi:hypothetical protein